MKIAEATDQQKLLALAELDGCKVVDIPFTPALVNPFDGWYFTEAAFHEYRKAYPGGCIPLRIKKYLASYDAILPLVQKQPWEVKKAIQDFLHTSVPKKPSWSWIDATPTQIADLLLVATGKFEA